MAALALLANWVRVNRDRGGLPQQHAAIIGEHEPLFVGWGVFAVALVAFLARDLAHAGRHRTVGGEAHFCGPRHSHAHDGLGRRARCCC